MAFSSARLMVSMSDAYRRLFGAIVGMVGPRIAYAFQARLASIFYELFEPLRVRSEVQCRAALGTLFTEQQIGLIAKKAFVHRAWNLVDLALADRLVRRSTYPRYGGCIQEDYLSFLQDAQSRRQPVILVTAYYGPFDLLPLFLGYNGIHASVVYKPHDNAAYDRYRTAIRGRSGCELVPVAQAATRLPQVLDGGGTIAILADHHATRRGVPATFLNLATTVSKSVGLLAARTGAMVVVAGIRRKKAPFQFELIMSDFFGPDDWAKESDAVAYITRRYLASIEKIIMGDPSQYLWAQSRWGADLGREAEVSA